MSLYCDKAPGHALHGPYHDLEYGFPISGERALFERLCLEIMQAGLSWEIVLKKRPAFSAAFDGFDPAIIALYGEAETARLLGDAGIIRNRRKIAACIENARRLLVLSRDHGGFACWIAGHHPLTLAEWVKLFRKTFVFMGPEVVNEFLMSIGILHGAHRDDCPIQAEILKAGPAWAQDLK